jgi:hypothetical protein
LGNLNASNRHLLYAYKKEERSLETHKLLPETKDLTLRGKEARSLWRCGGQFLLSDSIGF